MMKIYGVLGLLIVLIAVSAASDWLEGGYVSSGDHGDIGQYFTDPIFSSPGSHYVSSDPALREMQESMDRPISALGSVVARPATGKTTSKIFGNTASKNAALANAVGRWHLELSEGRAMDLYLYQSGSRIFGSGNIAYGQAAQGATASGSISGSSMILDVVPGSGTELYSISLDISRLHLASPYNVFRSGVSPGTGTVWAARMP
jgi:hypothetical protein